MPIWELPAILGINKLIKNKNNNLNVSSDNFDNYMDSVESNLSSKNYKDLLASNPYQSYDYQPTFWDKLGNAFNFNTEEDRLRMQMQQSSRDYAAQVSQLQFENQYNSEAEQVKRMKAAGLNPDLNGGTQGASESSEFNQEQTSPDLSTIGTQFHNVANHVINAVVMGLDLAGKITNLRQMFNAVDASDLNNALSASGLASQMVDSLSGFGYQPSMVANPRGGISYDSGPNEVVSLPSPVLNKRNRARFSSSFNRLYHSTENYKRIYANLSSAENSRRELASQRSSRYWSDDDDVLMQVVKPLIDFNDKLIFYTSRNQVSYQSEYNGQLAAQSDNVNNRANIVDKNFHLNIQQPLMSIVSSLAKTARDEKNSMKGITASCILLFMNSLQSGVLGQTASQFGQVAKFIK